MEERADADTAIASQETVKLSVGFPLVIFCILTANDVEVFLADMVKNICVTVLI